MSVSSAAPFSSLPAHEPRSNHVMSYEIVLEKAFETLPPGNSQPEILQMLIIKIHEVALALVGQFQLEQNGVNESSPMFPHSTEIRIRGFYTSSPFISYLSQAASKSTFSGSHHFAAFCINYKDTIQPPQSNFQAALQDTKVSFAIENFVIQRIPDQWASFNGIEGLKFYLTSPVYMEVRVHERERSLIELQSRQIEEIADKGKQIKQKQLQLVDQQGKLAGETAELEKQKNTTLPPEKKRKIESTIQTIRSKAAALKNQLDDIEASITEQTNEFQKEMKRAPIHASCNPILRTFSSRELKKQQQVGEQLVKCLNQIFTLTRDHFRSMLFTFSPHYSASLKKDKLKFLNFWLDFLNSHNATNLGSVKNKLGILEELVQWESKFSAGINRRQQVHHYLSNENNYYLAKLRENTESHETDIDGIILSSIHTLVQEKPAAYLKNALRYFQKKIDLIDRALKERALINPEAAGEKRYLSSLDYARERVHLDRQTALLTYLYFFSLPASNNADPLTSRIAVLIKSILNSPDGFCLQDQIPAFSLLQLKLPTFFSPFETLRISLIDCYAVIEQTLKNFDPRIQDQLLLIQSKRTECLGGMQEIVQVIDKDLASLPTTSIMESSYVEILTDLLKILPNGSDLYNKIVELKKVLKNEPSEYLKHAEAALFIQNQLKAYEKEKIKRAKELFYQLYRKGLSSLKEVLVDFPKMSMRTWLALEGNGYYRLYQHLYWPTDQETGDPFYLRNETHIPLKKQV